MEGYLQVTGRIDEWLVIGYYLVVSFERPLSIGQVDEWLYVTCSKVVYLVTSYMEQCRDLGVRLHGRLSRA